VRSAKISIKDLIVNYMNLDAPLGDIWAQIEGLHRALERKCVSDQFVEIQNAAAESRDGRWPSVGVSIDEFQVYL